MSDTNICLTLIMSSTKVKSSRAAHRRSAKTVVTSVKEICASFGGEKSLQAKLLSYKVTLGTSHKVQGGRGGPAEIGGGPSIFKLIKRGGSPNYWSCL